MATPSTNNNIDYLDNYDENQLIIEAYDAIMDLDKDNKVIKICQLLRDGPFHKITMHGSTILHKAAYSKQEKFVSDLLDMVFANEKYQEMMTRKDQRADATFLHEMATSDVMVEAAKRVLARVPEMQYELNKQGETPLYRSACYGKMEMFRFLHSEMKKDLGNVEYLKEYFKRAHDQSTILPRTVIAEHFELALHIGEEYPYLAGEKDCAGTTPLQLLSCNPTVFYSGNSGKFFESIYNYVSIERTHPYIIPILESTRRQKQRHHCAKKLAEFLIGTDKTWIFENSMQQAQPKQSNNPKEFDGITEIEVAEEGILPPPLMLAAKYGCMEIVQGILEKYHLAIEYEDKSGCNILHVALKNRRMAVFDYVAKMDVPMRWLIRKLDDRGNSIMHMVGIKEQQIQDFRNPALQLHDNLQLFEKVKKTCKTDYVKLVNANFLTAEKVFAKSNATLHTEAKDWMKRTSENCSLVAILIATVAFAAAYTVPGGVDDKTGIPIFVNDALFITFAIADVLSITFSLTSVVVFLSILTSPYQMIHFKRELPRRIILAFTLLLLGVSMMMVAFSATIVLTIKENGAWVRILLYSMASLPVSIFLLSYLKLYKEFWNTLVESLLEVFNMCPSKRGDGDEETRRSLHHSATFSLEDEGYWA